MMNKDEIEFGIESAERQLGRMNEEAKEKLESLKLEVENEIKKMENGRDFSLSGIESKIRKLRDEKMRIEKTKAKKKAAENTLNGGSN